MTNHVCKQLEYKRIEMLYNPQLTDAANAEIIKVSRHVVADWRHCNGYPSRKRKFDTHKFTELYKLKYSDNKIANELRVSRYYITTYRNRQGLPPNDRRGRSKRVQLGT